MISVKVLAKQVEKFTLDNSPAILTGVGAFGSVTSVVLAVKATLKASPKIEAERERIFRENPIGPDEMKDVHLSPFYTVKLVWLDYLPSASALTISVASIICANRVSTKRAAALAAAYSLSEKAYSEYREKIVEKFNTNKERGIRDEIAQDQVNAKPPTDATIIITGNGDVVCFDKPSGRYFKSNMEKLRSVQNDMNSQVIEIGQATLDDLYASLNLKATPYASELGWTTDKLLDIQFSAVLTTDNQPCISIDYHVEPVRGAAGFHKGCSADPDF